MKCREAGIKLQCLRKILWTKSTLSVSVCRCYEWNFKLVSTDGICAELCLEFLVLHVTKA